MEQDLRAGCPVGSSGGHEVAPRRLGPRLLIATLLWLVALGGAAQAATPLRTIVEDVPGSTAYRYAVRDSMGNSMDTLKIVRERCAVRVNVSEIVRVWPVNEPVRSS